MVKKSLFKVILTGKGRYAKRTGPFSFPGAKMKRVSRKTLNASGDQPQLNERFQLKKVIPLTTNQAKCFNAYYAGKHLNLHGYAGTGKTYISFYLALKDVLTNDSPYDKVIIIRSVVQSRDMGFLPGSTKEKTKVFEEPYKQIADDLFGRGDGYDILKMKKLVEFTTTSFLRGLTFNDAIILVDETQNMNFQEIDTIMTRVGNNSRIIFCGDYRQTDLTKPTDFSGINDFIKIARKINTFEHIEFDKADIVRSGLVKDYIIQKTELGL